MRTIKRNDKMGLIRLLLCVMIFIFHYTALIGPVYDVKPNIINSFFVYSSRRLGSTLPICFFVLSGYVITNGYADKIFNEQIGIIEFITKRIKRLYPAMVVSIALMTVAQMLWYYNNDEWWTNRPNDLSRVILSLSGVSVGTFFNCFDTVNGPIWYISVLMICYFLFFIAHIRLKSTNIRFFDKSLHRELGIILIGFAALHYGLNLPFLSWQCSMGYIGFFSGVILAENMEYVKKYRVLYFSLISFPIVFGILVYYFRSNVYEVLGSEYVWLVWAMASIILIIERLKYIDNKVFSFLGRISFPMYIFQMPVMVLLELIFSCYFIFNFDSAAEKFMIYTMCLIIISIIWDILTLQVKTSIK